MKNNGLKYLVIAALLVNAATLIFFWVTRPPRGGRPPKETFDELTQELKLDNDQQKIYKALRKQHHSSHDSLLQLIAEKRQVLYRQKPTSLDSIIQPIGQLQQEIELITYQHFEEVRKICTPKQQAILDELLVGAVQHVLMPKNNKRPPPKRD